MSNLPSRTANVGKLKPAKTEAEVPAGALPYPPSLNTYWRSIGRGRVLISAKGRAYREAVAAWAIGKKRWSGVRLKVVIEAHPPDKRVRDLDNIPKALLDALTHAGVIDDDGDIDELHVYRGCTVLGGYVALNILALEP